METSGSDGNAVDIWECVVGGVGGWWGVIWVALLPGLFGKFVLMTLFPYLLKLSIVDTFCIR